MIITQQQQEAMVRKFAETATKDMTIGFIHGMNAMMELIEKLNEAKKNNLIN